MGCPGYPGRCIFLYRIYILIRDTRATALLKGLIFLGIFTVLAGWLQLHVVSWILDKLMTVLIVALPVVFQPELRRALEQIGRGKFYVSSRMMNDVEWDHVIGDVVEAAMIMSANKIGALIVFERSVGLDDKLIRASVSRALSPRNFSEIFSSSIHRFMTERSSSGKTGSWQQDAFFL